MSTVYSFSSVRPSNDTPPTTLAAEKSKSICSVTFRNRSNMAAPQRHSAYIQRHSCFHLQRLTPAASFISTIYSRILIRKTGMGEYTTCSSSVFPPSSWNNSHRQYAESINYPWGSIRRPKGSTLVCIRLTRGFSLALFLCHPKPHFSCARRGTLFWNMKTPTRTGFLLYSSLPTPLYVYIYTCPLLPLITRWQRKHRPSSYQKHFGHHRSNTFVTVFVKREMVMQPPFDYFEYKREEGRARCIT